MNRLDKKITIPTILHEFHGYEATYFDLLITYLGGILSTLAILYFTTGYHFPIWKLAITAMLGLDLSGGVIANFTKGTSMYYAANPRMRILFISLHPIQPIVLLWIFPLFGSEILVVVAIILLSMTVINGIKSYERQRVFASFLTMLALVLIVSLDISSIPLSILLLLLAVKLILAFAVRWKTD